MERNGKDAEKNKGGRSEDGEGVGERKKETGKK